MRRIRLVALTLALASAVGPTAVAHAQSTRPQLVVERATADFTAETLLIEGQNLLWNSDSDVTVTQIRMSRPRHREPGVGARQSLVLQEVEARGAQPPTLAPPNRSACAEKT